MKKKGFTLIEILVTVTVVGILAGLTLTASMSSRKVARDGKRKADLEQIRSALEIYRSDVKAYPASLGNLVSVYLDKVPDDPLSGTYTYSYTLSSPNSYTLCSYLETSSTSQPGCGNCSSGGGACYYKVSNY